MKDQVQSLTLALSKGANRVGAILPSPEDGDRSSFWNVAFFKYLIPDDGQSPETQWFWQCSLLKITDILEENIVTIFRVKE
jgi:hypothetical protein